jgi:hypothetical protein
LAEAQAVAGTAMLTVTDQDLAAQEAVQLHQVMAAELQIIDIETSQQTEHRDRDSRVVQEYVLTNRVKTYMLPEVAAEQADREHVHQITVMTEK